MRHLGFILVLLNVPLLVSCISVSLPESKTVRSEQVRFRAPASPYKKSKEAHLDAFWSNPANGNSISYLSDCGKGSDPSLDTILKGVIAGLESPKIMSSETHPYNQREALKSTVLGKVDGVPTQLKLTVFKKNGCIYILTYVALKKTFALDEPIFSDFERRFSVP